MQIISKCCWRNFCSWWCCKREIYFRKYGRKMSISYYTAEVTNEFNGYEGGMRHCRRLEITSKFIFDTKYEYFSILRSDKLRNLPPPWLSSLSKCQAPQLFVQLILVNLVLLELHKMYNSVCNWTCCKLDIAYLAHFLFFICRYIKQKL